MDVSSYIWAKPGWPDLTFRRDVLAGPLSSARLAQGKVLGLAHAIGLASHPAILEEIWIGEAMATASIEGEKLNLDQVRSSVMRKIGSSGHGASSRDVDGLVDVMEDAASNFGVALTHKRLCDWQAALFPAGRSGLAQIEIGRYRTDPDPMRIVSGRAGRGKGALRCAAVRTRKGGNDAAARMVPRQRTRREDRDRWPRARRGCASLVRNDPSVRGRQRADRPGPLRSRVGAGRKFFLADLQSLAATQRKPFALL